MKMKKIPITGIVINYIKKGSNTLAENRCPEILEKLSGIPVIGIIPNIKTSNPVNHNSFEKLADIILNTLL